MIATATRRLSILLRLRRQREDLAAQEFARAKAQVGAILAGISRLEESLAEHNNAVRDALAARLVAPPSTLGGATCNRTFARYRVAAIDITAALAGERARLDEAQAAMDRCREELVAAMKQRKAMDHLVQRERGRQVRQIEHEAVKEWDDLHATHAACMRETGE